MAIWYEPAFWKGLSTGVGCCVALGLFFVNPDVFTTIIRFVPFGPQFIDTGYKTIWGKTKMVLVVRGDCKMQKGKIAAQCAHAAILAYRESKKVQPSTLQRWVVTGQAKVVVKVESEEEMLKIAAKASRLGLVTEIVRDAGLTQLSPRTRTVLSVGPGPSAVIDQCTDHLKLL
ncbi:peptidyl-tRNA hydrolase 2 [Tropilaelaps mercedesae]|uniref:peptidyl-tRNA hydrolase n=1 Tax=Tropilaelaps mercedesae TaxID=418985 RepID=A0A1V9XJA7_9ACAR|nr:peptidyl-tRNA hydrolase 2 [Tropilaelaps mercedesae]